jgi:hypothetical protein
MFNMHRMLSRLTRCWYKMFHLWRTARLLGIAAPHFIIQAFLPEARYATTARCLLLVTAAQQQQWANMAADHWAYA